MTELEKLFDETKQMPAGDCPLPEPGRGAPLIEHVELISVEVQPINFDPSFSYDKDANQKEKERFEAVVRKSLEVGEITQEEADRILKAGLN